MGSVTISREIKMNNFNADLELLENLSKRISDLIYNNDFSQISSIDKAKALIKKITESEHKKNDIKKRIGVLVKNNVEIIKATEKN